jgi:FMN phosphatase YigB (HAD superfamily)
MSLTLLFDLDNTLLGNQAEAFGPAYFQALARHLQPYAPPQSLIHTLLAAIQRMVENRQPDQTLEAVFDASFYPALGLEKEALRAAIDAFYIQEFPRLRQLTHPRPEAIQLVETALERGYRVAIATNPLFPRTAIMQRLEWAELPAERYPFSLVPSFETFHFAKPHADVLAEFLARMGWPTDPVVMVGDDLQNDIAPARKLGIPAFWIAPETAALPAGPEAPSAKGTITDLLPWLDATPTENLEPHFNAHPALLAILRSTPAALHSLCNHLPPEDWTAHAIPGEWAPIEILCHLRDADAEVNLPRLQKVIQETNPFLPGKDTDPWAEERRYILQDGPPALRAFTAARLALLTLLENLAPDDWNRPARHAIFGPSRLHELVNITAAHDRVHIRQMWEALDK